MSKIAIVTDSNSGITQSQAKEMGLHVLPMPFMIDGETFYEEITLSQEHFIKSWRKMQIFPPHSHRRNPLCSSGTNC